MPLDDAPEAILRGPIRSPLVHDDRGAVGERSVHDVAVAGHPPDVRRAPVHIVVPKIEDPLRGRVGSDEVPASGVHDPFRFPGRSGRVEDVEHVLGVHRFGRTGGGGVLRETVIPVVPALLDVDRERRASLALDDDDVLDRRRRAQRLVGRLLQRHDLTAAPAAVRRNQERSLLVVDAVAERLCAEASEHDAVDGADARAREHRDRELRDEGKVYGDPVAALHAERLEDVREAADLAEEIEVGQRAPVARLAFPHDGGLVAPRGARVAIDAVDARVDLAADEPPGVRRLPLEDAIPRPHPLQLGREPRPERFGVRVRRPVRVWIGDVRGAPPAVRRREAAILLKERVDFGLMRHPGYIIGAGGSVGVSGSVGAGGWVCAGG